MPETASEGIPVTYVPARNTIFLAFALALGGGARARDYIYAGVNAIDYSGYPDCRPEFIHAFQALADLATRRGVEGSDVEIRTPLIDLSKADIIRRGLDLGVDYALTVSCYQADGWARPAGVVTPAGCAPGLCRRRVVPDPTRYKPDWSAAGIAYDCRRGAAMSGPVRDRSQDSQHPRAVSSVGRAVGF